MKTQAKNFGSIITAVSKAVQLADLSQLTTVEIKDSISNSSNIIHIDIERLLVREIMRQLEEKNIIPDNGSTNETGYWKNGIAANLESIECTTNGDTLVIATQRNESENDSYNTRMLNIMEQFGTND